MKSGSGAFISPGTPEPCTATEWYNKSGLARARLSLSNIQRFKPTAQHGKGLIPPRPDATLIKCSHFLVICRRQLCEWECGGGLCASPSLPPSFSSSHPLPPLSAAVKATGWPTWTVCHRRWASHLVVWPLEISHTHAAAAAEGCGGWCWSINLGHVKEFVARASERWESQSEVSIEVEGCCIISVPYNYIRGPRMKNLLLCQRCMAELRWTKQLKVEKSQRLISLVVCTHQKCLWRRNNHFSCGVVA